MEYKYIKFVLDGFMVTSPGRNVNRLKGSFTICLQGKRFP